MTCRSFDINDPEKTISRLALTEVLRGFLPCMEGPRRPGRSYELFLETKIDDFPEGRNDPTLDALSNISPYLHFGQLSPLYVALKVMAD